MGLNFYFGETSDDAPGGDPHGHRAFLFETLRELSDVAETQIVGMNGYADIRIRFPYDEIRRIQHSIRENVPPERMRDFMGVIEGHERETNEENHRINGRADAAAHCVLAISLRLNSAVRALLISVATGNDPIIQQDEFTSRLHDQAIDGIIAESVKSDFLDEHPEDAMVTEEEEEDEDEPWSEDMHHWKPDDDSEEDEDDEESLDESIGLFWSTPAPEEIDPETEALILAEAAEVPVDMDMLIRSYRETQAILQAIEGDSETFELRQEYHEVILAVMQHVHDAFDGKTNLECLVYELRGDKVLQLIESLSDLERTGCIDSIFHNVAETALMQVQLYSDMVNSCSIDDEEENEASMELTLTFIQRLRERLHFA